MNKLLAVLCLVVISSSGFAYPDHWTSRQQVSQAAQRLYGDMKNFQKALYLGSSSEVQSETNRFKDEVWDFYHDIDKGISYKSAMYSFDYLDRHYRDLWDLVHDCPATSHNSYAQSTWRSVTRSFEDVDRNMFGGH